MASLPDPLEHRHPEHEIHEAFLRRWSPRAMAGTPISQATLHRLFEAARWAPSSMNEQEWRFLYAHRETDAWPLFLNLLMEANQAWVQHAGVLIVVVSKKTFSRNGNPNPSHSLDTGMAVQNLLLQAAGIPDLVTHPMAGFDRNRAKIALGIPDDFDVECMIALGNAGDPDLLSAEHQKREIPSPRKPVAQIACEGKFAF
jgi:nitroreductase